MDILRQYKFMEMGYEPTKEFRGLLRYWINYSLDFDIETESYWDFELFNRDLDEMNNMRIVYDYSGKIFYPRTLVIMFVFWRELKRTYHLPDSQMQAFLKKMILETYKIDLEIDIIRIEAGRTSHLTGHIYQGKFYEP